MINFGFVGEGVLPSSLWPAWLVGRYEVLHFQAIKYDLNMRNLFALVSLLFYLARGSRRCRPVAWEFRV